MSRPAPERPRRSASSTDRQATGSPGPNPRAAGASRSASTAGSTATADGQNATTTRLKDRRRAGPVAKLAMALFGVGGLGLFAVVIGFAAHLDIPLWLELVAGLAPVGVAVGLIGVMIAARRPPKLGPPPVGNAER